MAYSKKKKKYSSFDEWSDAQKEESSAVENDNKKKKYSSFNEWSDANHGGDDDDIAPVDSLQVLKNTVKAYEDTAGGDKDSVFKAGAFDDGYQFGDVTASILGTVGDIGLNVVKGAGRLVEGVVDLGTYGVAGVADLFGADDAAEDIKKFGQRNLVDDLTQDAEDAIDRYSFLGDKADMVAEGLGQVGGIILTGGVGSAAGLGTVGVTALTTTATGLSGMGSGMTEAYSSGATDEEAFWYGLLAGATEAGTELMFGGLGKASKAIGVGKSAIPLDDILAKTVSKGISNRVAKNFVEYGIKATAEGVEEVVAGYLQAHAKKGTYKSEEDFSDILEDENLLEQFIVGTVTSAISQSGYVPAMQNGSLREANKTGRDFITGYTQSEQTVIDKEVANRVAEKEKNGTKLTKKQIAEIEETVQEELEHGQISIDTIESTLGGDAYKSYKDTVDSEEALKTELETLSNIERGKLTRKQEKRLEELEAMNLTDTTKRDGLRKELDDTLSPLLKDSKLQESYREVERKGQALEVDLNQYKGKQREAVERAVKSGVLNNTYKSKKLVDTLSRIEADKGIAFDYTNNEKLKESGFAVEGKSVNGYVKDGNVTLNVQSAKAWQSVVGHEVTHILEGTDAYGELQSALYAYAESKGELESRKSSITELYNGMDANIDSELTADLVGDYLFADPKFINHLTGNRNVFQKVYDEIKYLCKVATGKELTQIEKVKREFDKAWKEMSVDGETNSIEVSDSKAIAKAETSEKTQFDLSNPVEETKNLMAIHNLHTSEVLKQLEMGGIAYPSVAITDTAKIAHEDFGDISLILKREAIDPKNSKYNKIYSTDAYTPTFPSVDYEASREVAARISDKVKGLYSQLPQEYTGSLGYLRDYVNIDDRLNTYGGESGLLETYADNYDMKQLYLAEMGEVVPTEIKRTESRLTDTEIEMYQSVVDALGAEAFDSFRPKDGYTSPMTARKQWYAEHGAKLKEAFADYWSADGTLTKEEAAEIANSESDLYWNRQARLVYEYTQNGGTTVEEETDIKATNAKIDEKIDAAAYTQWLKELFGGIEGQSGIRNNRDTFTPRGDRRSFKQLHDPVTLDNVIKAMRGKEQKGEGAFGIGNIYGAAAQEYGSIEETKSHSGELGVVDQAEYDEIKNAIDKQLFDLALRYANGNDFADAKNALVEAVAKCETKEQIAEYLRQYDDVYKYTDSIVEELVVMRDYIRSLPRPYFEAKPSRAVGFDEVAVFVIPRNADVKLKQELLNRGYDIAEYDPDVEGDRQRVVNQFEQYKFSLSNVGEQPSTVGTPLQDLYYAPTQERKAETVAKTTDEAPVFQKAIPREQKLVKETPFPDEIAPMTEEEANALQDEKAMADAKEEGSPKTRKQLHNNIINDIKATFSSGGFEFDDVLEKAKNLSTLSTVDNTPQRVMEKALGYKEGQILSDLTVNKVAQNETEGIKWLNSFTDRKNGLLAQISKQYKIKPASKESAAAQMYAEGFYVTEDNEIVAYGDAELAQDFPDANVRNNIKGLARDPRIRQIYDETLAAINKSRARNAYPEIQRLDNYFLHFRAMEDTFSRLGLPFNPNDIRAKDLPTDLNGVTADLKPGQPYFASANHRKGKRTSFDLLGGLERYLTSAKNQIYHIDDIQTLRALRNYIADNYGQANGLEGLDMLTDEEAQARVEQVYDSHLSTFAKFLNEEANVLAGKTSLIDRGLEGVIGRRGMTFLDTVNRQVGTNMVGFNISSALTNFIPVAQTFAKTNKFDFLKAFTQTVSNRFNSIVGKSDGFAENSPVIIRRKGADRFYRTPYQKVSDAGYVLMSAVDNISTELIARTKFNELTRKGMSEQQAHFETDKWVSRLMGDRSLGQMPQLYNSKTLGVLTKFQLEVRNQLDSQFYDTIQEAKVSNEEIENGLARNAKTAAKVTSTFVQLAVAQHLFGKAFESVAGYNPAFDIISVLATMFGFGDDEEGEDTALDNIEQGFLELLEDLPYTSAFTGGGRIPISSALPLTELIKGEDSYGNEKSRLETLTEAAPYYILPSGYGQIKKTTQGLSMFSDEHPVAGSYTDSGNLRFPVEDTPENRLQAAVFGQYASGNAREYFDNGYAPLKEKQIQEYVDVELPIADYWKYREGLTGLKTNEEKANYIDSLDIEDWQKNLLINNILDRKESVDMSNYGDYSSFEEFDYAQKNPDKYALAKTVGGYTAFKTFSNDLYDIKADKDEFGKSITGSRKEKVIDYINNLDASYEEKIILFKSEYPADDTYNMEIIEYVNNNNDLTFEERVAILTQLGFTVQGDTVYWD